MATFALNHDDLSVTFYSDMQTDHTAFSFPEEDFFGDIDDTLQFLNNEHHQPSLPSPFGFSVPYFGPVLPPEMTPDSRIRFTELPSAGDEPIFEPSQDAEPEPTLNATDNDTDPNHPNPNATTETNKRRTRRVIRPITQGNNRYGRRGQRRCHQCRKWKQKCEYESIELPCKLCKERGFECGAAQKVKGPKGLVDDRNGPDKPPEEIVFTIPQKPTTPMDEMLTDVDRRHLKAIDPFIRPRTGCWNAFLTPLKSLTLMYSVPEFIFSSKAFRFSYLAFSASCCPLELNQTPSQSLEYMVKFHQYIKEDIRLSSFGEVFLASYMAILCEYSQPRTVRERFVNMIVYAKGMVVCLSQLMDQGGLSSPSQVGPYTVPSLYRFLRHMWAVILRDYVNCPSYLGPSEIEIEKVHELSISFVCLGGRISYSSDVSSLVACLNMELHSFLRLRKGSSNKRHSLVKSIKNTIQAIVQQIIELVMGDDHARQLICMFMDEDQLESAIPDPWSDSGIDISVVFDATSAIRLYGMAIIANQIIAPNLDVEAAISRSRFLCRLFSWAVVRRQVYLRYKDIQPWFWLAKVIKEEIDVDTNAKVRETLTSSIQCFPWRDDPELPGRVLALLDRVNSWTVEEVLLGSRLDEEDILRFDYYIHRRWWS